MNTARKQGDAAPGRSIAGVLAAVARETGELHAAAERLQTLPAPGGRPRPADGLLIEEAQALDALAQNLDALTGFLQRLSQAAPPHWRLDISAAIEPVLLADLARRLAGDHGQEDGALPPPGDFEMF